MASKAAPTEASTSPAPVVTFQVTDADDDLRRRQIAALAALIQRAKELNQDV